MIDTDNGPSGAGSQCLELNDLSGGLIEIDRYFTDVVANGGRLVTFQYDYRRAGDPETTAYWGVFRLGSTYQGHWWQSWSQWNGASDIEGVNWGWDSKQWPAEDYVWHTVEWTILYGDESNGEIGVLLKLTFDGTEFYDFGHPYLALGYWDVADSIVLLLDEAYWAVEFDDQVYFDNFKVRGEAPPSAIPLADAGPDQNLDGNWDGFTLDASGSSDDGEIVRYRWTVGGTASLYDGPDAIVLVDIGEGTHTLQLDVWDNDGLRNADTAIYDIGPRSPIADEVAGPWGIRNADISGTNASDVIPIDTSTGEFEVVSITYVNGPWNGLPPENNGNIVFDRFGSLYFLSWNELLESYDKAGNHRWRGHDGGAEKMLGGDIGNNTVIAGIRYIYVVGGDHPDFEDDPKVYAFEKSTGQLVWESAQLPGENWAGMQGRPKVTLYNDKLYVVGYSGNDNNVQVHQVDASTGAIDWTSSCYVELQYMLENNAGNVAFVPDAYGAGLHGLFYNQMSDWWDFAGFDGYADFAAIVVDPTSGAVAAWDPPVDAPGLERSNPIYSSTTGKIYTPSYKENWSASLYAWSPASGVVGTYAEQDAGNHGGRRAFALDFDGVTVHATSDFDAVHSYRDNGNGTFSMEVREYGGYLENGWGFASQGCLVQDQNGDSIFIVGIEPYEDGVDYVPPKIVALNLSEPVDPNGHTPIAEWQCGQWDADLGTWDWNMPLMGPTPGPDGSIYFVQNDHDWWGAQDRIVRLRFTAPSGCDGDLDGDGQTGHSDLGILLGDWGCSGDCVGDLDGDGQTGHSDLGILLGDWGCGT